MRSVIPAFLALALLVAAALYAFLALDSVPSATAGASAAREGVGAIPEAGRAAGEPKDELASTEREASGRSSVADRGRLSVTLRIAMDGVPMATGEVVYCTSTDALVFGSGVLAQRRDGSRDPRARVASVSSGQASLRVPGDHWIWARVANRDATLRRHALLRPETRGKSHRLMFRRGKPRIHAFVLDEDLSGVGSGGIALHLRDMIRGGRARQIARSSIDELGHVQFDIEGAGLYIVTPTGVRPESRAPHRATVLRRPKARDHDYVVKVARQRPTTTFPLVVTSASPPVADGPIVLYLENLGSGPRYFPIRYSVRRGRRELGCTVPAGRYRLQALPDGVLAGSRPDDVVEVFPYDTPAHQVDLKWNEKKCRLELEGVHRAAFPVTVSRRESGRSGVTKSGGKYIGPYRWGARTTTVCAMQGARYLNVVGPQRSYVSSGPVDLSRGSCTASLTPATLVTVRVAADASSPGVGGWVLLSESSLGRESSTLRRELLQASFGAQILRSTQLLLPHGMARLVLWDSLAKRVLAERTVTCQGASAEVNLRGPSR